MNSASLITLLLLAGVFYLFIIAPQRRRMRAQQATVARLEPGTEVMTTAGLYAVVRQVTDDAVLLEVAPGVVSRYAKGAIAKVVPPEEPDEPDDVEPGAASSEPVDGHLSSEEEPGSGESPEPPRH